MKNLLILSFTMLLTISTFSQQKEQVKLTKEYYLDKSKHQKTTGLVFLGVGATMAVAGILVGNNEGKSSSEMYGANFDAGAGLLITGIAAGLGSIPFFVSSSNNAGKAAAMVEFHPQPVQAPSLHAVARIQVAIRLRISI